MAGVHDLFNNKTLRSALLKLRLPLALAGLVALLFLVQREWFLPGLVVSAIGTLLQLWCFACIKTRKVLAVVGPYMFVRNPMYLSRFIAILGVVMLTGSPWIVGIYIPVYYLYMLNRVRREEEILREVFGRDYVAYCEDVRRFVPGFKRFNPRALWGVDWENFQRNHGVVNVLTMAGLWVILYVATFLVDL